MDVKQVRRENLDRLIKEAGNLSRLAAKGGSSYDNLSQIVNGTLLPSGKPRGIGNDLARSLEVASKKPVGWMDQDHTLTRLNPLEEQLIGIFRRLEDGFRDRLLQDANHLLNLQNPGKVSRDNPFPNQQLANTE
jgi:hypothetical protein